LAILAWPRSLDALRHDARTALDAKQFERALQAARQALARQPDDCRTTLLAARAALGLNDPAFALELLVPAEDCLAAQQLAAETAYRSGYARQAETALQRVLKSRPDDVESANQLAYLLGVEGRAFEALTPLFLAVQSGSYSPHHLIMLAAGEPVVQDPEFVKRCQAAVPEDPLPLLGQAREALTRQDFSTAEALLRPMVAAVPGQPEVQARWGSLLLQKGSATEFLAWNAALPEQVLHPEIWAVRGQWARRRSETSAAIRCFWEALKHDPNHRLACYQLGQLLQEIGKPEDSDFCLTRAARLEKLAYLVDRIYENPQAIHLMSEAADLSESLGRIWEAWAWARGAALSDPKNRSAYLRMQTLQKQLTPDLPRIAASADPGRALDLKSFPIPHWTVPAVSSETPPDVSSPAESIQFEELAQAAGLRFRYDNGYDPALGTTRMLESMGGGVAVLDFDRDGWPDVYLTQAGPWEGAARPSDSLFQNQQGRAFSDVTGLAGVNEQSFSQGCTVGDFDCDGFPDLYIGNLGQNRLFRNQGDGTFVEVTATAGIHSQRWTTSCLMADLNADGLPDLYDVNYLSLNEAARTLCLRGEEARTCGPGSFHAEPDQLYVNTGDGRFQDVSESCGIDVPNGKGLGIVAGDLTETGQIHLFIANDSVPNFYFVNETSSPGGPPRFTESALVTGLALSHDGLSAAWMGVAAGDANGDGRIDLFSTTYADQAKSLFIQDPATGLFTDAIVASGLNAPTWKPLGFGTQFLDAELDGRLDLVITNGHVYNLSHQNRAYQMAPQFFTNTGRAQFREVSPAQLGPFFEGRYLGRGLARLDWNRDGLDDFVVSHMNAPAALVTNRTARHGNFLTVRLIGTQCSRDAIGAIVRLKAGTQSWTHHLTAGDGYQASNERKVHFGLGPHVSADQLQIRWPGGSETVLESVSANTEWVVIEGQTQPVRLSSDRTQGSP